MKYVIEMKNFIICFSNEKSYNQCLELVHRESTNIPPYVMVRAESIFEKDEMKFIKNRHSNVDQLNSMIHGTRQSETPGYHIEEIVTQGVYGELSKIKEELEELQEANQQQNKILELVELSDMYGAIEGYVESKFGMTMEDLKNMSDATKRAFHSGARKSK